MEVVEEYAGGFHVPNEKFAGLDPDFSMRTGHNLLIEGKLVGGEEISSVEADAGSVGEATYAERGVFVSEIVGDRLEAVGAMRVEVGYETNAVDLVRRVGTWKWRRTS